jgi:hypothetical protein
MSEPKVNPRIIIEPHVKANVELIVTTSLDKITYIVIYIITDTSTTTLCIIIFIVIGNNFIYSKMCVAISTYKRIRFI